MQYLEAQVKSKLKSIRAQYTRERLKTTKWKTGTGTDDVYTSKWPHYKVLAFLNDFVVPKSTKSNLTVSLSHFLLFALWGI